MKESFDDLYAAVMEEVARDDSDGPLERTFHKELLELLSVIKEVHSDHADDLCWMSIDRIFQAAGLPVPDRSVGDKEAMLRNCRLFVDNMCGGGTWMSYAQLEAENERARVEIQRLKGG